MFAHRHQVIARVKAVGERAHGLAQGLAVAQMNRTRQGIDLGAGVVDVIFAGHVETGERQKRGESVAEHGAAAVADMHRPGRIGRDIFDVDFPSRPQLAGAVAIARRQNSGQHPVPIRVAQAQIDKAGAGHLDRVHVGQRAQRGGDRLGQVARLHAGALGQNQGRVGGDIAMRGVARRFHRERAVEPGGKRAGLDHPFERYPNMTVEIFENIHYVGVERSNRRACSSIA